MRLSTTTFFQVFREICDSLVHHGFEHLVAVNGHGGNVAALTVAVNHYFETDRPPRLPRQWWDLAADVLAEIEGPMIHAEEAETSLAMALGQRVETDRATRDAWDRGAAVQRGRPAVDVVRPVRDARERAGRRRADGHAPRHHRVGRGRRRDARAASRPASGWSRPSFPRIVQVCREMAGKE